MMVNAAHDYARALEAQYGADNRWAVAARRNADFLDASAKRQLMDAQREQAANDV